MEDRKMEQTTDLPEYDVQNGITYKLVGDVYLPMIDVTNGVPETPLRKWGRMRRAYLKEERIWIYNDMLLSGTLYPHLHEIDETAEARMEQLMTELKAQRPDSEAFKAKDQMGWVGWMNNLRSQAEEVILNELIYS